MRKSKAALYDLIFLALSFTQTPVEMLLVNMNTDKSAMRQRVFSNVFFLRNDMIKGNRLLIEVLI
ncbi:hypothetical protein PF008_g21142 [Phytophthora fragariae]|uniref:PiggyBac transposable element-derived protein domain-containing protein n=1 Tax=Phytophthora fragariae TaxID=53985 RepID=A0A6G0QY65_9STRA|nr:hypothetical protein PF008_g21142 [Phytophthora fragariae]